MWIIPPATSGAPHGTADCGGSGRRPHREGTPPVGTRLSSMPTDRALAQMADQKVTVHAQAQAIKINVPQNENSQEAASRPF